MEIKVKIFGTGPDQSGCRIPKEVMEEALKKPVTSEWVHLGKQDTDYENISTIAGKLKKIDIDSDGAFATVETLGTPNGQIVDKIITEMSPDAIEIVPIGYFNVNDEGIIDQMDITGYSIEPKRDGEGK